MTSFFIQQASLKENNGQSILEIIVALALFAIISSALVSLLLGSFNGVTRGRELVKSGNLAQEGIEAVRSIRNSGWNNLIYNRSAVSVTENGWSLAGEGTVEQAGDFMRSIDFYPVYRDDNGSIVASTSPQAILDIESKDVSVVVTWEVNNSRTSTSSRRALLTNWDSFNWVQTDWSGGAGQNAWSDDRMYQSDDGNVEIGINGELMLKRISTTTLASEGSLVSSEYQLGAGGNCNLVKWDATLHPDCPGCEVRVQIKTAPDNGGIPGTWSATWSGPDGDEDGDEEDYYSDLRGELINIVHNTDRWIKYKVALFGDTEHTPVFSEIMINCRD